ncbi:MAG: hypothetical protein ACI4II_04940 [Acutalibacteraceae bacterium]
MKEFILTLLAAVLTTDISVATTYIVTFLKKKGVQIATQTENSKAQKYINEATDAIATAVTAVSQTYVDALKNDNAFTKEAQEEALNRAMNTAVAIMSAEAKEFIITAYGDLNNYLTAKIEENVRLQKSDIASLASAVIEVD